MKLKIQNFLLAILLAAGLPAWAQSCQTREEIPEQARTALDNAAKQTFDQAARGDLNSLRTNSITTLNFDTDVASPVNGNKAAMQGATAQIRTSFLLDTGPTPSPEGRFYCGVFGANGMAPNGAEFDIPNLPAGKYGVVFQDFNGPKGPYVLSTIFQDVGGWKIADFRLHPEAAVGHDGLWYLEQARQFKTRGQNHNAWFYYVTSWDLLAPVPFMESRLLSKILQESGSIQPKDVPTGGKPVSYTANGKTYNITEMSVLHQDNSFDLSLKYSVPSTADFNATQADARNLANALVTQYPELKEVFNRVWAHAVDPSGGDVPGLINLKPSATASATP
jgi:hypothetical protein